MTDDLDDADTLWDDDHLTTIELEALATVDGGAVSWKYWYYRAGLAVAHSDPARIATNFLM